ncbi:hypothetical protein T4A_3214 [Trichinella pseudospiralis]|uniref:Uncharacterized protein n=1 Tax=Trichinella pseudospiralis TaxID=6337 RepID=A0A0V0XE88_TRIPS|nr:hypothetical protein T4E_2945 [Trichinella pseudospiralis]KRY62619.1 hypothetical protein T4A_3214 [Trichinella pseudospiralis]
MQDIDHRSPTLDENRIFFSCFTVIVIAEGLLIEEIAIIKVEIIRML